MRKRYLPDYIPETQREWKQRKRREWKAVLKAIDVFRLGCAFTPAYGYRQDDRRNHIDDMEASVKRITRTLSYKEWGR